MSAPRLSKDTKDAIAADYAAGVQLKEIAARYGVHYSYASHLARRRGIRRNKKRS